MGEGTRDTGFMLEWMLFPEKLQEDCTICYFLKTAGEKNEQAESLRSEGNAGHRRVSVCLHSRRSQFVYLHFVCTHMYTRVFTYMRVHCHGTSRVAVIYLGCVSSL